MFDALNHCATAAKLPFNLDLCLNWFEMGVHDVAVPLDIDNVVTRLIYDQMGIEGMIKWVSRE